MYLSYLKCSLTGEHNRLTKLAGNVILSGFLLRCGEDKIGVTKFDQFSQIHIGRIVGNPRGLLHIVGDNDDGVIFFQFEDQVFDMCSRDWVER